jgi:WD40 repeat protein
MAYGESSSDAYVEQVDDKGKKPRQYTTAELNAFWSASTLVSRSLLPFPGAGEPNRIAFADQFRNERKHRVTVSTRTPPQVAAFVLNPENSRCLIDSATVSLDGTLCAASFESKTVVWSLPSQPAKRSTEDEQPSRIYHTLFHAHNKTRIDFPTGRGVLSLDFAPDAPLIVCGSSRGAVGLWSVENALRLVSYTGLTSRTAVWDARWCSAGAYIGTATSDGYARLWRTDIPYPVRVLSSGEGAKQCHMIRWHPSCQLVATATDETITVHEISGPSILFRFDLKGATAMEFSPTGYLLAVANAECLTVYELNSGSVLFQWDTFSVITSLAWSHPSAAMLGDGGLKSVSQQTGPGHPVLISLEESGTMRVWDRLFISRQSSCELRIQHDFRALHMHVTPRNLLVMAGVTEHGDVGATGLNAIRYNGQSSLNGVS